VTASRIEHRDRHPGGAEAARRERHAGLEQALELEERLVVESYAIDVLETESRDLQAALDREAGKRGIVLAAGERLAAPPPAQKIV
jgi:hypothetical protein